jgi:7-keto-8-aminopelargonate synthetase-like enzyme
MPSDPDGDEQRSYGALVAAVLAAVAVVFTVLFVAHLYSTAKQDRRRLQDRVNQLEAEFRSRGIDIPPAAPVVVVQVPSTSPRAGATTATTARPGTRTTTPTTARPVPSPTAPPGTAPPTTAPPPSPTTTAPPPPPPPIVCVAGRCVG